MQVQFTEKHASAAIFPYQIDRLKEYTVTACIICADGRTLGIRIPDNHMAIWSAQYGDLYCKLVLFANKMEPHVIENGP